MTEAFSSNCELVLQQSVNVTSERNVHQENLVEVYQIDETCQFINSNLFTKVALQFPDELLVDSVAVAAEIERRTKSKLFILGDTSYGSCCVDEVAAEHVGADCIVHYGSACLSPSKRLPLMYVFDRRPLDLKKCASSFREFYTDRQSHVIVLYDVNYAHVIDNLLALLLLEYPNIVNSTLLVDGELCHGQGQIQKQTNDTSHLADNNAEIIYQFGRQMVLKNGLSIEDYSVFFIGHEGSTLTNFMMTWNKCSFCSFDPVTMSGRSESISINKALMKRFYAIERAKDAKVVGILVGTLGVANYLAIIEQLKETIHKAGKKSYMFAMGKLNVAKLANFMEIDIYVLIACPENSLLDSRDFYKPVVTPYEMEMACNKNREWTGQYVTDFSQLLPGGANHVPLPSPGELKDCDETDVSLITGALRTMHHPSYSSASSSVMLRNQTLTMANTTTAASFLVGRSWQGLEQKLGKTPVTKALEGKKGIAIAYEEDIDWVGQNAT
ncbi:2-(3-amino-3-carboxypropyl)histidine synthase subunit 2 [Osmerus eperlanus]|uniref:2-(3-amino-3-carboxypropyl)histidine synthase subunit 2 n=1 Tax=Osmerus eperlanus TaxID=29151 RepID=UPI002E1058D3